MSYFINENRYVLIQSHNVYHVFKVWVLIVDNKDVKRYTSTEAICEFTLL